MFMILRTIEYLQAISIRQAEAKIWLWPVFQHPMTPVMKAINIMTKHEMNKAMVDLPMSVKKYRKYSKIKKNCEREEDETSVQPAATTDLKSRRLKREDWRKSNCILRSKLGTNVQPSKEGGNSSNSSLNFQFVNKNSDCTSFSWKSQENVSFEFLRQNYCVKYFFSRL